jgi:hypothetical protein
MDGRKLDVILYCKYISTATGFALGYSDYDVLLMKRVHENT